MTKLGAREADALIRARLGRPAQDALEAAVALEAWGGARGDDALAVARELMGVAHLPGKAPPPPPDARPPQAERTFAHGAAAVATAVLLALWAPPLTSAYGGAAVTDAVTAALPLALGLQWVLRARAVPGPRAIAHLRAGWPAVAALVASTLLLALLPIDGAAVAAGLALTWVTAAIVAGRGWGAAAAGLAALVGVGLWLDVPAGLGLALGALAMSAAAAAAIWTASGGPVGSRDRSSLVAAGICGACVGIMLVSDGAAVVGVGALLSAAVLVPSAIGAWWAGSHLARLTWQLARDLCEVPLANVNEARIAPTADALAGSVFRFAAAAAPLSLLLLFLQDLNGGSTATLEHALIGVAIVAAATLPVAALEALGSPTWAAGAALAGATASLFLVVTGAPEGLAAGGGGLVMGLTATCLALELARAPAATVATRIWIR